MESVEGKSRAKRNRTLASMQLELYFLIGQCIITYYQHIFVNALIGQNVRYAESDEFPFMVCLTRNNGNVIIPSRDVICSGTLVTQEDVLSSAHCIDTVEATGIRLIVGSIDVVRGAKFYPQWWITFDQWSVQKNESIRYTDNDIIMIRVIGSVPDHFYCSQLSSIPSNNLYNLNTQVAGWGVGNDGNISRILQTVNVRVLTHQNCEARISNVAGHRLALEERAICTASEPYALLNSGDSGGSLLYNNLIVGVNKGLCPLMNNEFHPNKVNIHFSIEDYEDFILDVQNCF